MKLKTDQSAYFQNIISSLDFKRWNLCAILLFLVKLSYSQLSYQHPSDLKTLKIFNEHYKKNDYDIIQRLSFRNDKRPSIKIFGEVRNLRVTYKENLKEKFGEISEDNAKTESILFEFDRSGKVISKTDKGKEIKRWKYDAKGMLLESAYQEIKFVYQYNINGLLSQIDKYINTDLSYRKKIAYDQNNNATSIKSYKGDGTLEHSFEYFYENNLLIREIENNCSKEKSEIITKNYEYNSANKIAKIQKVTVSKIGDAITNEFTQVVTLTYDPKENLIKNDNINFTRTVTKHGTIYCNQLNTDCLEESVHQKHTYTMNYDQSNNLIEESNTNDDSKYSYKYDADNKKTNYTSFKNSLLEEIENYIYDEQGNLIAEETQYYNKGVSSTYYKVIFTRDRNGNITDEVYSKDSQITKSTSFLYDFY